MLYDFQGHGKDVCSNHTMVYACLSVILGMQSPEDFLACTQSHSLEKKNTTLNKRKILRSSHLLLAVSPAVLLSSWLPETAGSGL